MISFRVILGFLFAALIATITVLSVVSYRENEQRIDASSLVNQTWQVIECADRISIAYEYMQLESNAYFIDSDSSLHSGYLKLRGDVFLNVDELRELTIDNPVQGMRIDSLEKNLKELIAFNDSAFTDSRNQQRYDESLKSRIHENNLLRKKIRDIVNNIKKEEKVLLENRRKVHQGSMYAFNRMFALLLSGIAILLLVTFFTIRYNFNKRSRIEKELKQAQQFTKQALTAEIELNELKTNFVTLASHEFRTPLTTILSSSFLLENQLPAVNREIALKQLRRIRSSVKNLTSLLDEFLSVSKIEEGSIRPKLEQLDMPRFIQNICNDLQSFAKQGQVILYQHTGDSEVETDPVLLGNIMNNLISNSIKYSPEASEIHVSSSVNNQFQLSVQDNGIGIPKEDQKHLFTRFYRASNASAIQGTGLGLHIMKHYAEMLNGFVELNSEMGKGTTVKITFNRT